MQILMYKYSYQKARQKNSSNGLLNRSSGDKQWARMRASVAVRVSPVSHKRSRLTDMIFVAVAFTVSTHFYCDSSSTVHQNLHLMRNRLVIDLIIQYFIYYTVSIRLTNIHKWSLLSCCLFYYCRLAFESAPIAVGTKQCSIH